VPGLSVTLRGQRLVDDAALRYDRAARSTRAEVRRYLRRAARIAREGFREQFSSSGRAFGLAWRPLAASTLRYRGSRSRRPMIGRGNLLRQVSRGATIGDHSLQLAVSTRAGNGRSLIRIHELSSSTRPIRAIRHPVTGVAGKALRRLEREWELTSDRLVREVL